MIVVVIFDKNSLDLLTDKKNKWLDDNGDQFVIMSISPVMPLANGGGLIQITYSDKDKVFEKVK